MEKTVKETLEKQLQLLSERSKNAEDKELASLSSVMVEISHLLLDC